MDIADQFEKVAVLLAKNRLVTVLKKVTETLVSAVIAHGVTGQKPLHNNCDGCCTGLE